MQDRVSFGQYLPNLPQLNQERYDTGRLSSRMCLHDSHYLCTVMQAQVWARREELIFGQLRGICGPCKCRAALRCKTGYSPAGICQHLS